MLPLDRVLLKTQWDWDFLKFYWVLGLLWVFGQALQDAAR